jgi:excisionase family DNA binding protein
MVVWLEGDAYLTAPETCALLGIKRQTLYAYVSRGLLRSFRQGIRRARLYRRREVEALVRLAPASERAGRPQRRRSRAGGAARLPRAEDWIGDR